MNGVSIVPGIRSRRFYVSASLSNVDQAHRIMLMMEETFDMDKAFRWEAVPLERYANQAAKEVAAVRLADLFIGLLPGRLGSQAEIGASLMRKCFEPTRIVLWAPSEEVFNTGVEFLSPYPNVFWHHTHVERVIGPDPLEAIKGHFMSDDRIGGW